MACTWFRRGFTHLTYCEQQLQCRGPTMQMEGDKNWALSAADMQPDGQTKGFNQPNGKETHAWLSKHTNKHTTCTMLDPTLYTHIGRCQSGALQGPVSRSFSSSPSLHPLTPPPTSSPKRLQASGCKQLQSTGEKWTSRQARVDSQHTDLKEAKHSQLWH